jgi:hypothetical protein
MENCKKLTLGNYDIEITAGNLAGWAAIGISVIGFLCFLFS